MFIPHNVLCVTCHLSPCEAIDSSHPCSSCTHDTCKEIYTQLVIFQPLPLQYTLILLKNLALVGFYALFFLFYIFCSRIFGLAVTCSSLIFQLLTDRKSYGPEILREGSSHTMCHVSRVTRPMPCVTCYGSCVKKNK